MSEQEHHESTPTDEAADNLAEVAEEAQEAVEEAVEIAHEAAVEPAAEAGETIADAAQEASDAVEEAVEAAVEASPHLDDRHYDEIVSRVMHRLHEEGHLGTGLVASPDEVVEDAVAAPEVLVDEAPINPVREHWYYRPRRVGRRSI